MAGHRYKRGDRVEWWSRLSGPTTAIFVEFDHDFPEQDAILAIPIGRKNNRMTHQFRWPLRLMGPV